MSITKFFLSTVLVVLLGIPTAVFLVWGGWSLYEYTSSRPIIRWNLKIKELCRADGGARVFERVGIRRTAHEQTEFYEKKLSRHKKKNGIPYYTLEEETVIHEANPKVFRSKTTIYRTSSDKKIAELVDYYRVGGDPLFSADNPPTSTSCVDFRGTNFAGQKEAVDVFDSTQYLPERE